MSNQKIGCKNCKHYYITWDTSFPYGCKLFGIKSKQMPYIVVYNSLGKHCDNYEQRG